MEKYHLIGIKGTGMCALACILDDLGYEVQGSDYKKDYFTSRVLKERKIKVFDFDRFNIDEHKKYISSLAYNISNIEINEIVSRGYQLQYYNDFIREFFKGIKIGVSGTHGKTTVTTIIKSLLPKDKTTYLIGDGQGGGVKNNEFFVFEACEYRDHFLKYNFDYLVINNIELDHPDYFNSINDVINSFQKASNLSKHLIINGDDTNCSKIVHPNKITFGLGDNNDIKGTIISHDNYGYKINVSYRNKERIYTIPHVGIYMVYNFLSAISVLYLLDINLEKIQELIIDFNKPLRRMEEYYYFDNIIIDDYAHHPTEIRNALIAVKQKFPQKQLVVIFQPHTYSRTLALLDDFTNSFEQADILYLAKTFTSVRENFNPELEKSIFKQFKNAYRFNEQNLKKIKKYQNSVIVFLGAGDINKYIKTLLS